MPFLVPYTVILWQLGNVCQILIPTGAAAVSLRSLANGLLWVGGAGKGWSFFRALIPSSAFVISLLSIYSVARIHDTVDNDVDVRAHAVIMCQTRGVAWGANTRDILYGEPPTSHSSWRLFLPFRLPATNQPVGAKVSVCIFHLFYFLCLVLKSSKRYKGR